jgi:ferric-dicitrate binding protein FerR (iron transport regulator)
MSDSSPGNAELPGELPIELSQLADAACVGKLSEIQQQRLSHLLRDNETARLAFTAYLNIHAQLLWLYRGEGPPASEVPSKRASLAGRPARRGRRTVGWAAALVGAAAAAVAIIALFVRHDSDTIEQAKPDAVSDPSPVPSRVVATLGPRSERAAWERHENPVRSQSSAGDQGLAAGVHRLKRGVAEIRLEAGTRATLCGRTEIELTNSQRIRLNFGQLAVLVQPQTREFVVETPHADIIDRGTEFAVFVDASKTVVHVYAGEVEAVLGPDPRSAHRVLPGKTLVIRVADDGSKQPADVSFEQWQFARSVDDTQRIAPALGDASFGLPRFEPVPLDAYFTRVGDRPLHDPENIGNNLSTLQTGWNLLRGTAVPFQVADGVVQLASSNPTLQELPEEIQIPLNKTCRALHFLQATGHTAAEGERVGEYVIRYEDGQEERVPLVYGRNTANWWVKEHHTSPDLTDAAVAWHGHNAWVDQMKDTSLALYAMTWTNPHPEKVITSLVMRSAMSTAGPFCVAVTLDRAWEGRAETEGLQGERAGADRGVSGGVPADE